MRPKREHVSNNGQTYMVTSSTWGRRSLFHVDRWAELFFNTLNHYRGGAYDLHEFVVMPDHFHILITPKISLERAVQYIKGVFSFRAKKELDSNMEVWQVGFQDHRIRDGSDYAIHVEYIHQNPVRRKLCGVASEYAWSSAYPGFELDAVPLGLKPRDDQDGASIGAAKAAPFQDTLGDPIGATKVAPFQTTLPASGAANAAPFQNNSHDSSGAAKAAPFQSIEIKEQRTR